MLDRNGLLGSEPLPRQAAYQQAQVRSDTSDINYVSYAYVPLFAGLMNGSFVSI